LNRRLISTGSNFERAYGYSRAVVQDPFVFVAGTTGYDYRSMALPDDPAAQARAAWSTIAAALTEAGSGLGDIVRATYYITDAAFAEPVLAVCGEILADIRPAATLIVVAGLIKPELKVEIEVTALKRAG
jgi:enamine deaminase RidA (YjgF/YER057c/UK114 family)